MTQSRPRTAVIWFRRDLRLADNAALAAALASCRRVHCVFVYDRAILDPLLAAGGAADRRVEFIHAAVAGLDDALRSRGGALMITNGRVVDSVVDLARRLAVDAVDDLARLRHAVALAHDALGALAARARVMGFGLEPCDLGLGLLEPRARGAGLGAQAPQPPQAVIAQEPDPHHPQAHAEPHPAQVAAQAVFRGGVSPGTIALNATSDVAHEFESFP